MAAAHALFCDAVRAVVHRWTALNLAVSNDWGNGNSSEKREAMVMEVCQGFAAKNNVDPSEVEQFLEEYLVSQFNTEADDESPFEVSHLICRLAQLIKEGNIAEAQALLSSPVASLDKCVAQMGPDSEVGSDEEIDFGEDGGMQEARAPEPEQIELTAEQQADLDDGWGVVVKTSKGRVKKVDGGAGGG
eukprot:CAMPEP_0206260068 /NCGR_PEP_ID=MMETSP0047_2-20121206/26869_1 /ASSEMBLY_ACC=CAM_ASM_000192 /TAXON_ID=195065 /ORGANISM="Chroomonas mesostigmatica_cf, Strain CCMP1168" /LENGTH=188 /DNA_ID=CAMNT_0053687081 /DNA_START=151 /DNA_END=714 /DNA_ORIENTATION=+